MGGGRSAPGSSHGHGRTTRIALLALLSLLVAPTARAEARPNVLLLVAEDLSPRLGAYGDAVAKTGDFGGLTINHMSDAREGVTQLLYSTIGVSRMRQRNAAQDVRHDDNKQNYQNDNDDKVLEHMSLYCPD